MDMVTRQAVLGDREQLKDLWRICFDDTEEFINWFFTERFFPEYCIVTELDGKIVSAIHGIRTEMNFRSFVLPCVVIGGVSTLPEFRSKGYMGRNITAYMNMLNRRGIPIVCCHPQKLDTYFPFGLYPVADVQMLALPRRLDTSSPVSEDRTLRTGMFPDLYDCYCKFASNYSVMLHRTYSYYALKMSDYLSCGAKCIVSRDENERTNGYCIYFDDETLMGEEIVALREKVCTDLLAELEKLSCGKALVAKLAPDISVKLKSFLCDIKPWCVAGTCNAAQLIRAAELPECRITIVDEIVPTNNFTFNSKGEMTELPAQLVISAGRLTQWLIGYRELDEIIAAGEAVATGDISALLKVKKRPCFIIDEY